METSMISILKDVSTLADYATPGLVSTMPKGRTRFLSCETPTVDSIWPHSHRYDLSCFVLRGAAYQKLYHPVDALSTPLPDEFHLYAYEQQGEKGDYVFKSLGLRKFWLERQIIPAGRAYFIPRHIPHQIEFDAGTEILLVESVDKSATSLRLSVHELDSNNKFFKEKDAD